MKKLFRKLLRDRKGISMTEVVVAMALVVIVTGAAISVLVASAQFDAKYRAQTQVLNACENAAECIRFAETPDMLAELLKEAGFEPIEEEETQKFPYTFERGGATVTVEHSTRETNIDRYVVIFDGEEIYEIEKQAN